MLDYNPIMDSDSYKWSHFNFYPKDLTEMYSYLESRGGKYDDTVFVGLEPILQKLATPITKDMVKEAESFAKLHGEPFNSEGWYDIVDRLGGKLPLEIKAVPEGSVIPNKNVLLTIRNTDPKHAWLTSFVETMLLRIWYPITVASRVREMKKKMLPFFEETGGSPDFSLVDFGSRGVSSNEQSIMGGIGHLVSFMSSDNIPAMRAVNHYYDCEMSGFSIPATEHSVTTSFLNISEQKQSIRYWIENTPDNSAVSLVGDTWDIFKFTDEILSFQHILKARNITAVIRPDSGDMHYVLGALFQKLLKKATYTINDNGHVVFDNFKILWGDGISEDTCYLPYSIAKGLYISAESVVIGSGGGLLQVDCNRDTNKFAIKGSNVIRDGNEYPIYKNPITDPGKASKKGKMILVETFDPKTNTVVPVTITTEHLGIYEKMKHLDILETRFLNGEVVNSPRWSDICTRGAI